MLCSHCIVVDIKLVELIEHTFNIEGSLYVDSNEI